MRRLLLARARAHPGLLLTLAATIALVVAAGVLIAGSLTQAMRSVVVDAVTAAAEDDRALVLRMPIADDAQFDIADRFLAAHLGEATRIVSPERDVAAGASASWRIEIDTAALDPWTTPQLAERLETLDRDARRVDGLALRGLSVSGGLADVLTSASASVSAVVAVTPVPAFLVLSTAVIAVVQLARLLGASRSAERAMLRGRGLSRGQAAVSDAAEVTVLAVGGALAGALLGLIPVVLLGGGTPAALAVALRTTWPVPVACALLLGALTALTLTRTGRDSPGSPRTGTVTVTAALAVAAAVVFLWMLGQPAAGAWRFAVVAITPALALTAAALLALAVFPAVARLVERLCAQRPTLAPAHPARAVARSAAGFGVIVILVALASAGAMLAGTATATWAAAQRAGAAQSVGADARVEDARGLITPAVVTDVATATGVASAGAVLAQDLRVGDTTVALLAVPSGDVFSDAATATAVDAALPLAAVGVALPAEATEITLTYAVEATGQAAFQGISLATGEPIYLPRELPEITRLVGHAWLFDAHGTPTEVALTPAYTLDDPATGRLRLRAELPAGTAPWTLGAVIAGFRVPPSEVSGEPGEMSLTLEGATASDHDLDIPPASGIIERAQPRLATSFAPGDDTDSADSPALISAALADRLGVATGDTFSARFDGSGRQITVAVAGSAPTIGGTTNPYALVARLDTLALLLATTSAPLEPDQLWATGPGAAEALGAALPDTPIQTAQAPAGAVPALTAVWWIAVAAAAMLAGIAVIALAVNLARRRAVETFVLRALGVTAAFQAGWRRTELIAVTGGALVVGAALGWLVALPTVPALTLAALPGVLPAAAAQLAVTPWPLVALVLALCGALAVASVAVRRALSAQARAGRVREGG